MLTKEISEVEKGCGADFTIKGFDIIRTGMNLTNINTIPRFGKCDSDGLCQICQAKLSTLKSAQAKFDKFVEDLKEELRTDLTGCFTSQKQCDEWNKDTNRIIDELSQREGDEE